MKLQEARKIVSKMIGWTMVNQGVISEGDEKYPKPITEDLETLLLANKIVDSANKRNSAYADKQLKQKGKSSTRRVYMTIADRGIAALYVAANFEGDDIRMKQADTLAYHQGNIILCVKYASVCSDNEEGD